MKRLVLPLIALLSALPLQAQKRSDDSTPFPGTVLLELQGDIASNLVAGVDRFLLRETELSIGRRAPFWNRDFSSH
jgi:hypothetical protein